MGLGRGGDSVLAAIRLRARPCLELAVGFNESTKHLRHERPRRHSFAMDVFVVPRVIFERGVELAGNGDTHLYGTKRLGDESEFHDDLPQTAEWINLRDARSGLGMEPSSGSEIVQQLDGNQGNSGTDDCLRQPACEFVITGQREGESCANAGNNHDRMCERPGDEVLQSIERIVPRQTGLVRGSAAAWREDNCGGTAEGLEERLALI